MDNAGIKRIRQEMDTIVRLKGISELELVERTIEWLDYEFHGVIPSVDRDAFVPVQAPDGAE